MKKAGEFGLTGTHRVAAIIALVSDIVPMGVAAERGLIAYESFYWDRDAASRAWTARWTSRRPGKEPNMFQACAYTAALHGLRAVQAAGTDDGPRIVAAMKRMPVDDSTTMRQPHRPADVAACKLAAG